MLAVIASAVLSGNGMLLAAPAMACTLCHSAGAITIRERLVEPDLLLRGLASTLPLPVLLLFILIAVREPAEAEESR